MATIYLRPVSGEVTSFKYRVPGMSWTTCSTATNVSSTAGIEIGEVKTATNYSSPYHCYYNISENTYTKNHDKAFGSEGTSVSDSSYVRYIQIGATYYNPATYSVKVTAGEGIYYLKAKSTVNTTEQTIYNGNTGTFSGLKNGDYVTVTAVSFQGYWSGPVTGSPSSSGGTWTLFNDSGTKIDPYVNCYGANRTVTIKAETYTQPTSEYKLYLQNNYGSAGLWDTVSKSTAELSATLVFPENKPSRSSYVFNSWNSKADGTGTRHVPKDRITLTYPNITTTYYAQWDPTYSYSISYYSNGTLIRTDNSGTTTNDTWTFTVNCTPTKSGYTLQGWDTSSSASTVRYKNGDELELNGKLKDYAYLYAVWKRDAVSKFYWDGSSGAGDSSIIYSGAPITNLTAARWNAMNAKIKELNSLYTYTAVGKGNTITAKLYNDTRSGIAGLNGHGLLPTTATKSSIIYAFYFNSTQSLKSALNAAIDNYNS